MKRQALALALAVSMLPGLSFAATQFAVDPNHSSVGFSARHLGISKVKGTFKDFSGSIVWDDADSSKSAISGIVKVSSIDTQNDKRDGHLRSSDFFDAAKFPEMKFVSKRIVKDAQGNFTMVGDLTIKDVTKEVSVPLTVTDTITDPWGKTRKAFEANFKINRNDFGIAFNGKMKNGNFIVSPEVEISLEMEGVQA